MKDQVYCTIHVTQFRPLFKAVATFTIHWPDAEAEIFLANGEDPIFAITNARVLAEERYGPIAGAIIKPITCKIHE